MADCARETLREARAFAGKGEWRLAIQRCELIRSRTRVSESILIETFGILGCGHVELGQYEEALSFLKRASPTPVTIAAAQRCYHELELSGDPRAVFERDADRQVKRKRRFIIGAVAGALALPLLACCGWLVWAVGDSYDVAADLQREMELQRAEGVRAGAGISVAECVDRSTAQWVECYASNDESGVCFVGVTAFREGCLTVAAGRDDFCSELPRDDEGLAARCEGRPEEEFSGCIEAVFGARLWCDGGVSLQ